MRRSVSVAAAAAVLCAGAPAHAYVPEATPRRSVERAAIVMASHPSARPAIAGIAVVRNGRTIYGRNLSRAMIPASLTKLATTTAAMLAFGPRHRFATRVLAEPAGGIAGDLWIVGGGDPTLATTAYLRARFLPRASDPIKRPAFASGSPTIEDLAARVRAAGITRVTGDVVVDESLFDDRRTQRGWLPRYLDDDPDVGLLSALSMNEGMADLEGTRLVEDQARAAGTAFLLALGASGVRVDGGVRAGVAPEGAVEIARVESPPLAEIVDFVNRYSVNFPSEMLLKALGANAAGLGSTGLGSTDAGVAEVRRVLRERDVPLGGFVMEDGSGLSRRNRMTPATLAAILSLVLTADEPGFGALRASIPVAGRPGQLLNRLTGPLTTGNVRGKTGFLRGVRSLSGWVTALDGTPLVYVALFNDAPDALALTGPIDVFVSLLARFPVP
ncbi:MAG TPA: D-alanyl-D-alanine carboxypeptidase/D-alanyl-D-alanine-endopeptidase [Actinomycetota bacterium]